MSDQEPMKKILISIPEDWKEAFQERAEELGESLSEFLRESGRERLTKKQQRQLREIEELRGGDRRSEKARKK